MAQQPSGHRAPTEDGRPEALAAATHQRPSASDPAVRTLALEEELASVLEAVDAGVLTLGRDGGVRTQNETARRLVGRPIDDLASLFGPLGAGRSGTQNGRDALRTELTLVDRPDRWLEVTISTWSSGSTGGVVVIRDVTEARRSYGLRDMFLGMLSHELRTPVTSIYAASQLLGLPAARLDATDRAGLVEDIRDEAQRLLRLVEDLLVLAHPQDALDLLQEPSLLEHLVPMAVERERRHRPDIEINVEVATGLPVVVGDEAGVRQVVSNMIANACRYGLGRPVDVVVSVADGPGASVQVLDRGPGLQPEESEALFKPFYRSSRAALNSGGAGIGLYVCRRLVEAMGGHVWARPRDGGGSDFGFWLPEYTPHGPTSTALASLDTANTRT